MQGIEPKIHREMIKRINDLEQLLKETSQQDSICTDEIFLMNIKLSALYEEYLTMKKRLENCINLYRLQHIEIRKELAQSIKKLKREKINQK
ncbi:urease accessory protein UreF [Chryseobacterium sp. H1D6B]|uniref:hypothetical protein n=1 Tax=Chryseobacterium sp. H1D6B TaxID=2940588 RepID=UPI0015C9DB0F|nr:hypothetical protein [Chryseobacterium sp. H1D6B]MDH6250598.1 urease accessory protein UreF [Chryseobacterium sp. H1D6B]